MSTNTLTETGNLSRVLVATDGSDESAGAIRTGVALSMTHGARLIGLSIALDNPEYSTFVPNLQEVAKQHAREALKSFVEEAGESAETAIREATDSAQGIVEAATEFGADIIVMGQHNKGGLARLMVGDTTASVIGHAVCPVLVASRAAHLWEKHILLATDGSPHSEVATEAAGRLRGSHACRSAWCPSSPAATMTSDARKPNARSPLQWNASRAWACKPRARWLKAGRTMPSSRPPKRRAPISSYWAAMVAPD